MMSSYHYKDILAEVLDPSPWKFQKFPLLFSATCVCYLISLQVQISTCAHTPWSTFSSWEIPKPLGNGTEQQRAIVRRNRTRRCSHFKNVFWARQRCSSQEKLCMRMSVSIPALRYTGRPLSEKCAVQTRESKANAEPPHHPTHTHSVRAQRLEVQLQDLLILQMPEWFCRPQ